MIREKANRRRGFTLMEVLVSVSILAIVGTCIAAIFGHTIRGYSFGTSQEMATNSVTIALQKLAMEIRDGKSAVVSNGVLTVTYPAVVIDTTTGEQIYDLSANSSITKSYYVSDGKLMRSVNGTTSTVITGISSGSFYVHPYGGTITINLTGQWQVGSVTSSEPVVSRIVMRNYRT